ncbi:MAG: hypothetical protein R3E89_12845 [Thiolinea sp.]
MTAVDAGNRRIRRPVHLDEVCAIAGAERAEVLAVVEAFRRRAGVSGGVREADALIR